MEYIYSVLLLYRAGKEINESNVKKVLESAGIKSDEARVKALVASLADVDIEKAIAEASIQTAAPIQAEAKKEVKVEKKEEKVDESVAAAGLSALFG